MKWRYAFFISFFLNILLLVVVFRYWSTYELASSELPPPFLLDNPEASYSIQKKGENYCVYYSYGSVEGCYMVGTSAVGLDSYIGKKIQISGRFPRFISEYPNYSSNIQCIQDICHQIYPTNNRVPHEAIVVYIDSIQEK